MPPSLNPNHNRLNQLLQAWTVYVRLTIKRNWGKSWFGCSFQSCGDVVKLQEYLSDFHQCFLAYCSFKLQAAAPPPPPPPSTRLQLPATRNLLPPSVFFYCPITFNICTPSCLWFTMRRRVVSPYVADIIILSNKTLRRRQRAPQAHSCWNSPGSMWVGGVYWHSQCLKLMCVAVLDPASLAGSANGVCYNRRRQPSL